MRTILRAAALAAVALVVSAAPAAADRQHRVQRLQHVLDHLVDLKGGPPGVSAVLLRGDRERLVRAGVADVETGKPFTRQKLMRVASVAKAFSGAIALSLADDGFLSLDDTIGSRLPYLPVAWHAVTLRELLGHTSGLPDFSASDAFRDYFVDHLHGDIEMLGLVDFVRDEPLEFPPGSEYRYSNTDNIVVALMAEAGTGIPYRQLLRREVSRPLGLEQTDLPRSWRLPKPKIHGYDTLPEIEDLTECCSAAFAAASGGVTSTPHDLTAFISGYVGGELFAPAERAAQFSFVDGGRSDPPGPGKMSAGLALFRYETRCGTVYGHTGNIFGYTQFTAATANGQRAVTVSVNRQITPKGPGIKAAATFPTLRRAYRLAVCGVLGSGS
jgi:D-alanyl-D-alanine carboxypeptidase